MVVTAVVDTNTARGIPAALVAATIAGAWPKPSDARLTSASQPAGANAAGQRSRVVEVTAHRLRAEPAAPWPRRPGCGPAR